MGSRCVRALGLTMLTIITALAGAPTASGNGFGGYRLENSPGCGGTCMLKGVRASITSPSQASVHVKSGNFLLMRVSAQGANSSMQIGYGRSHDAPFTDCGGSNDVTKLFYESLNYNQSNVQQCAWLDSIGASTHLYKSQVRAFTDTGNGTTWGAYFDSGLQHQRNLGIGIAAQIIGGGEVLDGFNLDSTMFINGTYGPNGQTDFQRTSDSANGAASWTTIQQSPFSCHVVDNGTDYPICQWAHGALPSPFSISFTG
jgi:hypothetical protein